MATQLAEIIVKFGAVNNIKLPIFRSVPSARVAILEGRVTVDGLRRIPGSFVNPNGIRQHHTDLAVPAGMHRFELHLEKNMHYEWSEEVK